MARSIDYELTVPADETKGTIFQNEGMPLVIEAVNSLPLTGYQHLPMLIDVAEFTL